MAQKKVGVLVKEARTAAGLTQEQLARKVTGASAQDISQLERGEVDFTQAQLKQIAKATGVTQASLIGAPKNLGTKSSTSKAKATSSASRSSSGTAKKSTSSSSSGSTAKKRTTSSSTAKKSSSSSSSSSSSTAKKTSSSGTTKKSTSSSGSSMKVSSTEKRLVELYREADADTKKVVMALLKGEQPEQPGLPGLPGQPDLGDAASEFIGTLITGAMEALGRR